MRPLFLIGFMGAGKTTVGRIVADRLGRPFTDLDRWIEESTERSIDELFEQRGEDGFRDIERRALEVSAHLPDAVIACGGGIVTDEDSRRLLEESGDVVYLAVNAEEALARVGGEYTGRPLLSGADPVGAAALLQLRELLYEEAADFTVDTVGHGPQSVADRIVEWVVMEP